MHFIFEGFDGFLEIVSGDLGIFDDTTDDELVDSVGDGFLLVFSLPEETVLFDGQNLLGEFVEIGFSFVGLDFEEDE